MSKIELIQVKSGFYSTDALNQNFADIEAAIENTLSRNGDIPNSMEAPLDMNSKDILNCNKIEAIDLELNGVSVKEQVDKSAFYAEQAKHSANEAAASATLAGYYANQAVESEAHVTSAVMAFVSGYTGFSDGLGYDFGVITDAVTYFNRDFGTIV